MEVYLDNAATTPLDPKVFEEMKPYLTGTFGNPSSIHSHGRKAKAAVEVARKKVAELLNTSPSEIFFTSGGTEADNTAIRCTVERYGIQHIITSRLEHHAVLHTVEMLEKTGVRVTYLDFDEKGQIDLAQLEDLCIKHTGSLVTLMHGNNEIGNLIDLNRIGELCAEYGCFLHSDTVQTVGHFVHDLSTLKAHCLVGSAHKFHGPKGVGFLYLNAAHKLHPFIYGGAQERNMRGGTENVSGIIGLAKALELAYAEMDSHRKHISSLKSHMIDQLNQIFDDITFNGVSDKMDQSLYTVLNVSVPPSANNDMLLFNLDINGISASGGSACSSGTDVGSHVLRALSNDPDRGAVRFSFSKYNTHSEVDFTVAKLKEILS
ncbi:MAG: cysteine desulfurase family protein [Cyclobacteriaceae bacterium]